MVYLLHMNINRINAYIQREEHDDEIVATELTKEFIIWCTKMFTEFTHFVILIMHCSQDDTPINFYTKL